MAQKKNNNNLPATQNGDVLGLFEKAIAKLSGPHAESAVAALQTLLDLHERIERRKAEKAFVEALTEFQRRCPPIPKVKTGRMVKAGIVQYTYDYADFETIGRIVRPILNQLGISYTFDTECVPLEQGNFLLTATCTFRHVDGHSQIARFSCPTESPGGASPQQKAGIAEKYAKRRALASGLGLTQCEKDTDGALPSPPERCITEQQAANLQCLIDEVKPRLDDFLRYFGVAKIEDLTEPQYRKAVSILEKRRGGRA